VYTVLAVQFTRHLTVNGAKPFNFEGKRYDFDHLYEFRVSHGSAVTVFRCGGHTQSTCLKFLRNSPSLFKSVHFWQII